MKKKLFLFFYLIIILTLYFKIPSYAQKAEDYYYKANLSLTSGNITEAVTFYKLAAEKNPDFYEAYLGLSIAYRELGDFNKAHDSILKVIEIQPDYYQVYYNLGLILEKQNKPEEALTAYQKFLEKVPGASQFTDTKQRISRIKGLK
ncbi:MAG TPA: tetratricopeptide repeat protein [Candidatus Gastranaerophilales bacterium]|nr:tetratricopeptide repeat protein [Candidatus Gastranaerophilales bacterium]